MSYNVYKKYRNAQDKMNQTDNEDHFDDKMFALIKPAFQMMYEAKIYNPTSAPRFDLKQGWKHLKAHEYQKVLDLIQNWLIEANLEGFKEWEAENQVCNESLTDIAEIEFENEILGAMDCYFE